MQSVHGQDSAVGLKGEVQARATHMGMDKQDQPAEDGVVMDA